MKRLSRYLLDAALVLSLLFAGYLIYCEMHYNSGNRETYSRGKTVPEYKTGKKDTLNVKKSGRIRKVLHPVKVESEGAKIYADTMRNGSDEFNVLFTSRIDNDSIEFDFSYESVSKEIRSVDTVILERVDTLRQFKPLNENDLFCSIGAGLTVIVFLTGLLILSD